MEIKTKYKIGDEVYGICFLPRQNAYSIPIPNVTHAKVVEIRIVDPADFDFVDWMNDEVRSEFNIQNGQYYVLYRLEEIGSQLFVSSLEELTYTNKTDAVLNAMKLVNKNASIVFGGEGIVTYKY